MPKHELIQYRKEFEAETDRLLAEPGEMGQAFWHTAAVAVLGDGLATAGARTSRRMGRRVLNLGVEPDRDLAELICATEPVFETPPARMLRARIARRASWRRAGIKPKEGGIEGIRATRSLDEIDDALQSTFCLPPEMLMVKFAEEGFLVKHRPPSRQPQRDLMATLLAPGGFRTAAARTAAAAWVDACMRLWPILHKSRMLRTDLGLAVERMGGIRTAAMRLDHVPNIPVGDPFRLSREARLSLVLNSNLAPSVFDANPSALPDARRTELIGHPRAMLEEVSAALLGVPAMRRAAAGPGAITVAGSELSLYNAILVCQLDDDEQARQSDGPHAGHEVLHGLQLPESGRPLGVRVDLPGADASFAPFRVHSSRADTIELAWPEADDEADRLAGMLGRLSLCFIDLVLEAVSDG